MRLPKKLDNNELLTAWTLYMNSFYLLLNVISDSFFFFTKNNKMEYLNAFKMAQIVNILFLILSFLFIGLLFLWVQT